MLDSLVSSTKYEIIKTVYTTHGSEGDDRARLAVIQNTLGSLPLTNIATLDAITTHFTRLIELTSADETFISNLGHSLANCMLFHNLSLLEPCAPTDCEQVFSVPAWNLPSPNMTAIPTDLSVTSSPIASQSLASSNAQAHSTLEEPVRSPLMNPNAANTLKHVTGLSYRVQDLDHRPLPQDTEEMLAPICLLLDSQFRLLPHQVDQPGPHQAGTDHTALRCQVDCPSVT